jgi:hypothetical protein
VSIVAALVLLVATWILGLAILGAALAWRALAWTAEVEMPPGSDDRRAPAPEDVPGISVVSPAAEVIRG